MPAKPKAKKSKAIKASVRPNAKFATMRDPALGCREYKYIVEIDDVVTVVNKTLKRIHRRDGVKYFKRAAGYVLGDVAFSIEHLASRKTLRRELNALRADVG
jgi:hypothetical protein